MSSYASPSSSPTRKARRERLECRLNVNRTRVHQNAIAESKLISRLHRQRTIHRCRVVVTKRERTGEQQCVVAHMPWRWKAEVHWGVHDGHADVLATNRGVPVDPR